MRDMRTRVHAFVAGARSRWRAEARAKRMALGGATAGVAATALLVVAFAGPAVETEAAASSSDMSIHSTAGTAIGAVEAKAHLTGFGPEWDLPNMDHARVEHWIEQFQNNPRMNERYQGFLDRGGAWVPHMKDRLEARGMPLDLIFLSMVESGFSADAVSSAGAAGLWQFLRSTGQEYGLTVDRAVDERRDPVKATEAGLDYLERLHNRFGSWYVAMAAYNGGQGRVARIMRQTLGREKARGEEDYYRILSRLPRETQDYVPLIIAAGRIAKDPEAYGFRPMVPAPTTWEEFTFAPATPLTQIARLYGTTVTDVKALNPHLLLLRTPNDRDYVVRLPVGSQARWAAAQGSRGAGQTRLAE